VAKRDIVVIGASAGGVEALRDLCVGLPVDFPAAIFVVWHVASHSLGMLPRILEPASRLPVANAIDGQPITQGTITVAPPDHHMLLENGGVRLTRGPRENGFRPAVDPLFRSAAYYCGPRAIGVVLAGSLDDGTSGLWAIKDRGGVAIVQDPIDALFPDMPRNALRNVSVDYIVPAHELGELLVDVTSEQVDLPEVSPSTSLGLELESAAMATTDDQDMSRLGELSQFTCPECHGSLWRISEGKILRFRCRTGHAYGSETLLDELTESIEQNLWASVRGLEENASLLEHMGRHLREHGVSGIADEYLRRAAETKQRARTVRRAIEDGRAD
jgi:two-component system, chemotaxis family, protein-glutamate methylesterase/glutaminase